MPITLEEFQYKFKSEIAAASGKDEAALARVDSALRGSQRNVQALVEKHRQLAAAARLAEASGNIAAAHRAQDAERASRRKVLGAAGEHQKLSSAKPELVQLARQSAAAKEAARMQRSLLEQLRSGAARAGGPLGELESKLGAIEGLGVVGTVGLAAAAFVGLAAAAAYAAGQVAAFGFASASAARDMRILGDALTGSAVLGKEFTGIVDQLAREVPIAKGKIAEMAQSLSLLRLGRGDLQSGLTSIEIVTSAIGESAGGAVKSIVEASAASRRFMLGARDMYGELTGLAGTGLKKADILAALAAQLKLSQGEVEKRLLTGQITLKQGMAALEAASRARFGKTIEAQMLGLEVQLSKARENLGALFRDVKIEPVLRSLQGLLHLLDKSTVTGRALKTIAETLLNPLFGSVAQGGPLLQTFLEKTIIYTLQAILAVRQMGRYVNEHFSAFKRVAMGVGTVLAAFLLPGILGVAAGMAAIGAVAAIVIANLWLIGAVIDKVGDAINWLLDLDWAGAGRFIVEGLVSGLNAALPGMLGALKDLASKATAAFKNALGIASPSKLFASYGRFTVQGFASGVEQEAPAAQSAVDAMAPSPGSGGGVVPTPGGGSGNTYTVTTGDIYFGGKKGSETERQDLMDWILEQLTIAGNAHGAGAR